MQWADGPLLTRRGVSLPLRVHCDMLAGWEQMRWVLNHRGRQKDDQDAGPDGNRGMKWDATPRGLAVLGMFCPFTCNLVALEAAHTQCMLCSAHMTFHNCKKFELIGSSVGRCRFCKHCRSL